MVYADFDTKDENALIYHARRKRCSKEQNQLYKARLVDYLQSINKRKRNCRSYLDTSLAILDRNEDFSETKES